MPRVCTICRHPERATIEELLAAQVAYRNISARFGTSTSALVRHATKCLAEALPAALAGREVNSRELVLSKIDALAAEAREAADAAQAEGVHSQRIAAVVARGRLLDLEARVRGALAPEKTEVELRTEAPRLRQVLADVAEFVAGCCPKDQARWAKVLKEAR